MKCPKCNTEYKDNLAKFCIEKTKQCPNCYNKWLALPENDTDLTKYEIEYSNRDYAIIYAKNENEAREKFEDSYCGEYTDIEDISEIKRKGFGKYKNEQEAVHV